MHKDKEDGWNATMFDEYRHIWCRRVNERFVLFTRSFDDYILIAIASEIGRQ